MLRGRLWSQVRFVPSELINETQSSAPARPQFARRDRLLRRCGARTLARHAAPECHACLAVGQGRHDFHRLRRGAGATRKRDDGKFERLLW